MSKKVLIITYYWPPSGGAGVQRWLKFAKYLPEFDIEPIILTVDEKYAEYPAIDKELEKDTNGIQVIKTKTLEPFGIYKLMLGKKQVPFGSVQQKASLSSKLTNWIRANLFIPDARMFWKYFAISAAKKIIQENQIDYIITTSPPNSVHQIGYKLSKQFKIPWIMDCRDPWINNKTAKLLPKTNLTKKIDLSLQNRLFKACHKLIVVSKGMEKEYIQYADKLHVLTNGFDAQDYPKNKVLKKASQFVLSYNGNFKDSQNIDNFWIALKELLLEDPDFKKDLTLQIVGRVTKNILANLASYDLMDNTKLISYVEHSKSIELLNQATLLYLPIPNAEGNRGILTGKIFEYIATGKPILGLGPEDGNAADVLNQIDNSTMIDYSKKEEIKTFIRTEYHNFKNDSTSNIQIDLTANPFNRKNITSKLAKILK